MSEREALLAAIRANPEDDTPRLVFADWLDENEPDAKPRKGEAGAPSSWAALIRAECEFTRLQNDGSAAAAVYNFFTEQDRRTLEGVRWERAFPDVVRRLELSRAIQRFRSRAVKAMHRDLLTDDVTGAGWAADTHRGFPGGVWINRREKVAVHVAMLAATCPPVRITFPPYESVPKEFASSGVLRWCREAVVSGNHAELVRALSLEPDAARVRKLSCEHVRPDAPNAIPTALADSPNWVGLRELMLGPVFRLSAKTAERLFTAKHLRHLVKLDVMGDSWTPNALAGLNHLTELRELRVARSGLDDRVALQLANMPGLANLRHLELIYNRITGAGASALLASPHLKNLVVLNLNGNPIRGWDRAAIARAPAGGLRVLALAGCQLSCRDIEALASCPRLSELVSFDANDNDLAESAVARLVKGFGSRAPAVLSLQHNHIKTAGAQALANWPAAALIDVLRLDSNALPTAAAKAIATSPHLRRLNYLCVRATHSAGRAALKKQFGGRADV